MEMEKVIILSLMGIMGYIALIIFAIQIYSAVSAKKSVRETQKVRVLLQENLKELEFNKKLINLLFREKPLFLLSEILKEKKVKRELILEYLKRIPKIGTFLASHQLANLKNLLKDEMKQINFILNREVKS